MEIEVLTQMISSIGFPIAMCWLMWRKITDSDEKQSNLITELTKAVSELTFYIKGGGNNGG